MAWIRFEEGSDTLYADATARGDDERMFPGASSTISILRKVYAFSKLPMGRQGSDVGRSVFGQLLMMFIGCNTGVPLKEKKPTIHSSIRRLHSRNHKPDVR